MNREYAEVFKEETVEILEELEGALLKLEQDPNDMEVVAKIFRAIHTIKGSGAMFGFDMLASFAHEVENAYDRVREGILIADKKLIDLTLAARDFIRVALEKDDETLDDEESARKELIVSGFQAIIADVKDTPAPPAVEEPREVPEKVEGPLETTYRIRLIPAPDVMEKGTKITGLLKELHQLGICSPVAHVAGVPLLEQIDPTRCYISWDIILTTSSPENVIRDIFIFIEHDSQVKIEMIDSADTIDSADYKQIGNIMVEKGDLTEDKVVEIIGHKKKIGELLVEEGVVKPEEVDSALMEQQHVREVRKKRQETETASSLRVSSEKVDQLVNLVGELVTLQARLSQLSHSKSDAEMISLSEEVERITWELRDNSMEMRMLPIGSTFSRFKRLVRDLSNNLGKQIELTTEGGDTELDKTVIEKLNDPLVHIIRNSIDHGVETPAVRKAAGKLDAGNIHLSAFHSGSNVVIRITDDGAGLDTQKIRKKAIERGIISEGRELTDPEIFGLIFEPGFSTAQKVSDVSGRGVGMDVVRRNIEALRGGIEIDSQKGIGTTFTLNIPLTLAIIDGLLVSIGDENYVFPLALVESCIEIPHTRIAESNGRNYVNVRGEIVPYIYLREQFDILSDVPPIEQIVIADIEKKRVGFVVDHVIGGHQTVIKSLGKVYRNIEGISGATILGDGSIALILDIHKLLTAAGLAKKRLHGRMTGTG
ncbi:MAG: chemotaxis protein CheA [bacterium]|nr:chemotaxis protein CheA [bacterium]